MPDQTTRGRFVWHELMTADPAAAQTFYKSVVGWETQKWGDGSADYTMWMAGATPVGGVLPLTEEAKSMGARPSWTAYVEVPNVDDTIAETTTRGGSVIVPAQTVAEVGRFAILRDPQGAVFAVITNATPLGDEQDPERGTFSWHELMTTDWKSAAEFYSAIFGWDKKSEMDMGDMGTYHMFGRDRFTYGGMMNKPPHVAAPIHWLHYIQVDSADAAAERATSDRKSTRLNSSHR